MMKSPNLPSQHELDSRPSLVRLIGEITPLMIQRFATTVGDHNPLYFDEAQARAAGHPTCIAPPTFLPAVLGWGAGPQESDLMADGSDPALVIPETVGYKFVGGGQTLTFYEPLYAGDIVSSTKRLVEVSERESRSGKLVFLVFETTYEAQGGRRLIQCRETLIARP
jgi:acyl dehydratase